jgi:GNAT superfamily N-acetyltransferase
LGYLACDKDFFDGDGFYLRTSVVDDNAQNQGIAEALMRHAADWAFNRGARRVFMDVINRDIGQKLEENGAEKVGEINHMHAEGVLYHIYSLKSPRFP